jgi:hypothetical protein
MKNDRLGDWLWEEWDGCDYDISFDSELGVVYCTFEKVDLNNDLVKRALASCLQRDGVADSLSEGFSLIEKSKVSYGFSGYLEGEKSPVVCNENGETELGDQVELLKSTTWVEI